MTSRPASASRPRSASSSSPGGRGERRARARASTGRGRRPTSPGSRPSVAARSRSSSGRSSSRTATLTPIPTHRPALLRAALGEDPGDLACRGLVRAVGEQHVVGPLDRARARRSASATASPAASGSSSGSGSRTTTDISSALARRARTTCGPGVRGRPTARRRDERAVRRAGARRARGRGRSSSVVARRCRCGEPSAARRSRAAPSRAASGRPQPDLGVELQAEPLGGRAAVHGERERAVGVLVDEQLAGRDVGEGRRVDRRARRRRASAGRAAARTSASSSCSTSSVTLPKRSKAIACATQLLAVGLGERHLEPHELVGVDRLAGRRERGARGEVRGHGGEDVAAVEGRRRRLEAQRRAADVDRLDDPAEAPRGERQQAVVGADEDAVLLGRAQRDGATLRRRPAGRRRRGGRRGRRTGSARRRISAPLRTSWRGTPCETSMTRASGAIRAITPWQTPTKSSSCP